MYLRHAHVHGVCWYELTRGILNLRVIVLDLMSQHTGHNLIAGTGWEMGATARRWVWVYPRA